MPISIPGEVVFGTPTGPGSQIINVVPTENELPSNKSGFYMVTDSEKGGAQLYMLTSGARFWIAMVRDL
ncbi:hypothetical protein D7C54_23270 [Salmonella enterica]|nr:hypothetical protein [Salmonella enterica]EBX4222558.1 hypothetical protein [Salmonella enterica subsp. enterica serovar Heidelberg]